MSPLQRLPAGRLELERDERDERDEAGRTCGGRVAARSSSRFGAPQGLPRSSRVPRVPPVPGTARPLSSICALCIEHLRDGPLAICRSAVSNPTGDGLLVILDYEEATLTAVVRNAVETSVRLVEAFPMICEDDPMVNFDVPRELGIGLSRGAATRLTSGDVTLDYSGRPLNLASRLMDVARPSGVVFSDALGLDLIDEALASRFKSEDVYIKGLAEDAPMGVHYLAERTVISDAYRRPLHRTRQHAEATKTVSVRELATRGNFRFPLTAEPLDRSSIKLQLTHPKPTPSGSKAKSLIVEKQWPALYGEDARGPHVRVNLEAVAASLTAARVKGTWACTLWIEYAVHDA